MDTNLPIDVGALFVEHGARVLAFAHRLLGNRADAEDATQETFLKAHRQAHAFDGRCAPSAWLFAIARNTCLDRLRARSSRSFSSLEAIITQAMEDRVGRDNPARDAAAEAEWGWYVEAVREGCLLATLSCLSVEQRAAFVLRVLCEMSVRDTAAVLGRSENAVRILTHRARGSLKAFLCRNCSIYDPANACTCQNLAGFALAQGWVTPDDRRVSRVEAATAAARAAAALSDVARLSAVYHSLGSPQLSPDLAARIRSAVQVLDARPDQGPHERGEK